MERTDASVIYSGGRIDWYEVLGGRFLKVAGADVVPDGQACHA
jgi:hypothetical protein